MSESVERVGPTSPTDVTDGLTKNLQQTQPSLRLVTHALAYGNPAPVLWMGDKKP